MDLELEGAIDAIDEKATIHYQYAFLIESFFRNFWTLPIVRPRATIVTTLHI
jgi:hypothetical protein